MNKQQLEQLRKNKKDIDRLQPNLNEGLRSAFKQSLAKLNNISTRDTAIKQLKTIIINNKTTNNLRVWLSVLSENRQKHIESQIMYDKGLLDPLDKIPSLLKTVFRITQLLIKSFSEQLQNVALACQKTWIELYLITLRDQPTETKKKLLYDNLEAIINGGGGRVTQVTAQMVVDGLLEVSLSKEDHQFFKQVAKRTLVLFLKTTIQHPSTLTSLQTIIHYFNINNLIPLLDSITNKILLYIGMAQANSIGYKIKAQGCNCLALIGEQIDRNGMLIYERVIKVVENLAIDKVWAVQATGRKALGIWRRKKVMWEDQFNAKNQKLVQEIQQIPYEINQSYNQNWHQPSRDKQIEVRQNQPRYKSHNNWYDKRRSQSPIDKSNLNNLHKIPPNTQAGYFLNNRYLHKNTGPGGGNNVQSVENYYDRVKQIDTYSKKMEQIKKSIYKGDQIDLQDTVPWEQSKSLPVVHNIPQKKQNIQQQQKNHHADKEFLNQWEKIISLADEEKFQLATKKLLEMDDDIYFLRFLLKYSQGGILLQSLTRPTSTKLLKKMIQIKQTNFMQQILFKMVAESSKLKIGQLLSNYQNMQIIKYLQQSKKISNLEKIADKLQVIFENSLNQ